VWGEYLLPWSAEGYGAREARPGGAVVMVLTPQPAVECFRRGYRPEIHVSGILGIDRHEYRRTT
jgi:hypothetical protein